MHFLNYFTISGYFIIIAYLPLSLFVFRMGKSKTSLIYSLHLLSVALWGFCTVIIGHNFTFISPNTAWKFVAIPPYFIPVFFLHSVLIFTKNKNTPLLSFAYGQAFLSSILTLTGDLYVSFKYRFDEFFWPLGNSISAIFLLFWIFIAIIAHLYLVFYYKKSYPNDKKQIHYLLFAITGFAGGLTNYFLTFDIELYPFGNFLIPIHSFIVTYAILKNEFLDIRFAFRKSIAYSILVTILGFLYIFSILITEKFLQNIFNYNSLPFSILTAFILGLFFVPLRDIIQNYVNSLFFYKPTDQIFKENLALKQELQNSDKLKSVATLASGMAHEIKNPLQPLKTFSEKLPERVNDKEFLLKFAPLLSSEVDRIDGIVNDLLDFAKPSPPKFQPINIQQLIEDELSLLNNRLLKNRIKMQRKFDINPKLKITADSSQLKQALLNIFLNAIEAMPHGGTLTVLLQKSNAGINKKFKAKQFLHIGIQDTGQGITKEDLPRIFDPFYTKKDRGTGLGLAVTHQIIQAHKGHIWVDSNRNGTLFVIELPLT